MKPYQPDDEFPIELLAAYADGELDEVGCAQVEFWLTQHPEALADLAEQREFSPTNRDLWQGAAPQMPLPEQWDEALCRIEQRLVRPPMPARSRRRTAWYLAPAIAMMGMVAVLLVLVRFGGNVNIVNNTPSAAILPVGLDDEDGVFRIATSDDVELIQLPEEASSLIVVGRHPMMDTPLLLATTPDVDIYHLGPDDQGRMPRVEMIAGPHATMLVAHPLRR